MIPKKSRTAGSKLGFAGPDASSNNRARRSSALLNSSGWTDALRGRIANRIADDQAGVRDSARRAAIGGANTLLVSHLASKVRHASLEDLVDTQRLATTADVRNLVRTAALADRRDQGLAHVDRIAEKAWRRDPEGWVTAGALREWRAAAMTVAQGATAIDTVLSDGIASIARFDVHGEQLSRVARTIKSQADFDQACATLGLVGDRIDHRLARAFLARAVNQKSAQSSLWQGMACVYPDGRIGEVHAAEDDFLIEWVLWSAGDVKDVEAFGSADTLEDAQRDCDAAHAADQTAKTAAKWEQNPEGDASSFVLVDSAGNVLGATADSGSDGFCAYCGLDEMPCAQGLSSLEEAKAAVEEAVNQGGISADAAKTAQQLSVEEIEALGFEFHYEDDQYPDISWMDADQKAEYEAGELLMLRAWVTGPDGQTYDSLGGIAVHSTSDDYLTGELRGELLQNSYEEYKKKTGAKEGAFWDGHVDSKPKTAQLWDGGTHDYGNQISATVKDLGGKWLWSVLVDGQMVYEGEESGEEDARNACDHYAGMVAEDITAKQGQAEFKQLLAEDVQAMVDEYTIGNAGPIQKLRSELEAAFPDKMEHVDVIVEAVQRFNSPPEGDFESDSEYEFASENQAEQAMSQIKHSIRKVIAKVAQVPEGFQVVVKENGPTSFSMQVMDENGKTLAPAIEGYATREQAEEGAALLVEKLSPHLAVTAQVDPWSWSWVDDGVIATDSKDGYVASVIEDATTKAAHWQIAGPGNELEDEGVCDTVEEAKLEAEAILAKLIGV